MVFMHYKYNHYRKILRKYSIHFANTPQFLRNILRNMIHLSYKIIENGTENSIT